MGCIVALSFHEDLVSRMSSLSGSGVLGPPCLDGVVPEGGAFGFVAPHVACLLAQSPMDHLSQYCPVVLVLGMGVWMALGR